MQSIVPPGQSGANGGSAGNPTASTSYSSALAASMAQQQQQSQSKHAQQSQVQIPSAADISLLLSLGMGGLDASQLANLDLQKLAMYLVSISFEVTQDKKTIKFFFSSKFTQKSLLTNFTKILKISAKNWHKRNSKVFGDAFHSFYD